MRASSFRWLCVLGFAIGVGTAKADPFVISYHQANGSGTANVFDGGPPVHAQGVTEDSIDPIMSFTASDLTMTGSLGASARASVRSWMIPPPEENVLRIGVHLITGYFPSGFPGGDNPGGMAQGQLSSVIQFLMPADEIAWSYQLLIDETGAFHGGTNVLVQNITASETLLKLSSEIHLVENRLVGHAGDVIQITSEMWGAGTMGPGSFKEYESNLDMRFEVPEPGTVALLGLGCFFFLTKGKRG